MPHSLRQQPAAGSVAHGDREKVILSRQTKKVFLLTPLLFLMFLTPLLLVLLFPPVLAALQYVLILLLFLLVALRATGHRALTRKDGPGCRSLPDGNGTVQPD